MQGMLGTLYKKTSTGATQIWKIEVDKERYRMISGQLDGAQTTSAWTVAEGKNIGRANETSPEDQAKLEAEAAYELKIKKGYRASQKEAHESDRFQCMLADKWTERKDKLIDDECELVGGVFVQPKLDGIRCIATKDGLKSREGNPITSVPHITAALVPFFEVHPNHILDGELYNHELKADFNKIVSLVKKQKPTAADLSLSARMVQYWVYDGIIPDKSAVFADRYVHDIAVDMERMGGPITDVPTFYITSMRQLDEMYDMWIGDGFEGMMVRLNTPYENKRSKNLLKRKELMDAEFIILDLLEGVGNGAGMVKIATMQLSDGNTFSADVVGTREELKALLDKKSKVIGKEATIEFQNYTPAGKPRFPKLKVIHHTKRW